MANKDLNAALKSVMNATKEATAQNDKYTESLKELDAAINKVPFDKIKTGCNGAERSMQRLDKLGDSLKKQFQQAFSSISALFSAGAAVAKIISETKEAISELKEVDTLLTQIGKDKHRLSKADLAALGSSAFNTASKYGKSATEYLSGVQKALRAGYKNAAEIAELSLAAQNAGNMTAELADRYILAADKAYQLNGSVEKLTEILDGSNNITNRYTANMTELAQGMDIVGSTAASFGVEANETTAALGTMIAATQQGGSEAASAFKAILLNIRQVSDEEEGINAAGLKRYEQACIALGVSLREVKNGALSLRDPMEVLKELSEAYNRLDESDIRRTDLLNSLGGEIHGTQLDALLSQWSTYEDMLRTYAAGTGSMAAEAETMVNSWEGALNRLANTWADTVENIADSDTFTATINGLNRIVTGINNVTDAIGGITNLGGGLGAASGLLMNIMGIGERTMFQW